MLLTLPQVGKLTDRFDHGKIVIAGVVTTLLGTLAFTRVTDHTSYALLSLSLVVRGAGLGATSTPTLAAAYRHLRRDEIPNATTAINIVQRLGAPLGTAAMAVTLSRFTAAAATVARRARPRLRPHLHRHRRAVRARARRRLRARAQHHPQGDLMAWYVHLLQLVSGLSSPTAFRTS